MSPDDIDNNPTDNPTLDEIIEAHLSRRSLLKLGGAGASLAFLSGFYAPSGVAAAPTRGRRAPRYSPIALLGFASVPLVASKAATATQPAVVGVNDGDNVVVPVGYTARVLFSWGDPVSDGPAFAFDASQDWQAQSLQAGMHHDGIFFFPHNKKKLNSDHGLLCINHEYVTRGCCSPMACRPSRPTRCASPSPRTVCRSSRYGARTAIGQWSAHQNGRVASLGPPR